jgi:hypothetical protein
VSIEVIGYRQIRKLDAIACEDNCEKVLEKKTLKPIGGTYFRADDGTVEGR